MLQPRLATIPISGVMARCSRSWSIGTPIATSERRKPDVWNVVASEDGARSSITLAAPPTDAMAPPPASISCDAGPDETSPLPSTVVLAADAGVSMLFCAMRPAARTEAVANASKVNCVAAKVLMIRSASGAKRQQRTAIDACRLRTTAVCTSDSVEPAGSSGCRPESRPKTMLARTTKTRYHRPMKVAPLTRNMKKPSRDWKASAGRGRHSWNGWASRRSVRAGSLPSSSGTV